MAIVPQRIQLARYTAAQWTSTNPVLLQGEPGWEMDTDNLKFGDGVNPWNNLPYFSGGGSSGSAATTPGVVAYADNRTAIPTIGTTSGNGVTGCVIYVAKSDVGNMDITLEFGGMTTITTGGQGIIQLAASDWSGGVIPSYTLQLATATFEASQAAIQYGPTLYGQVRIGKIPSDRIYGLGVETFQQGGGLVGGVLNGVLPNVLTGHTWIRAVAS